MNKDVFSTYNPKTNYIFYIFAILLSVITLNPIFVTISLFFGFCYLYLLNKNDFLKTFPSLFILFIAISIINPLFNTSGETVLFMVLKRAYTLEALYYGMAIGAVFVSVMVWCLTYNKIMDSDKFLYSFRRLLPNTTFLLMMILRLVPQYKKKTQGIMTARGSIGKYFVKANLKNRIDNTLDVLSSLVTCVLEDGMTLSESMNARGFGSERRSCYALYSFSKRDVFLCIGMIILVLLIFISMFLGAISITYTPILFCSNMDNMYMVAASVAYILFFSIPVLTDTKEKLTWLVLKSKI